MSGEETPIIVTGPEDLSSYRVLLFHKAQTHHKTLLSNLRFCGLKDIVVVDQLGAAIQQIISQNLDIIIVTHFGEAQETTRLLEEIKGHAATADIPVVAVTNGGSIKYFLRIMAKGVDEVLVEPISQQTVEAKLKKVLAGRQVSEEGEAAMRQAEEHQGNNNLERAERIYSDFLQHEQLTLKAHLGLIDVLLAKKSWAEAEKTLKSALSIAKAAEDKIHLHCQLSEVFQKYGKYYERRGQVEKALKSYRTAFQLNPFNLSNVQAFMGFLQKSDELDEILGVVAEAKSSFLPYSKPMETVAVTVSDISDKFLSLGLGDRATTLFKELSELKHDNTEVHMRVSDYLMRSGEVNLTVMNLIRICARIKDPDLLCKLGGVLMGMGDEDFKKAPDMFKGLWQGDTVGEEPKTMALTLAKQAFHQAMLLNLDEPEHRIGLAKCELRLGKQDAAVDVLEKLKAMGGKSVEIYAQVIAAMIEEKAFDLALAWLKEATAQFPDDPQVAKLYAVYYREKGQHFEAIASLKKGLAKSPNDAEMILWLAESYLDAKEFGDAVFYFERAQKIIPDDPRLKEGLQRAIQGR